VPQQFDGLSSWLATNSHAGISALDTSMPYSSQPFEQLPMLQLPSLQQLPGLQYLHYYGVAITAAQASSNSVAAEAVSETTGEQAEETAPATQLLPLELSAATALTELQLYRCDVTV
jgi:hypothetical protein